MSCLKRVLCFLPPDFAADERASLPPLLFPCAAKKRETLPATLQAAGMRLDCLTCYETVAHPGIRENLEALRAKKVSFKCVCLAS